MQRTDTTGRFIVHVVEQCASTLTGGYEGCDVAVALDSLKDAQALMAALLGRNHAGGLQPGVEYARACAGGRRTVTLESGAAR